MREVATFCTPAHTAGEDVAFARRVYQSGLLKSLREIGDYPIAFTTLPRLPQVLFITICRQKRFIFILLSQPLQILDTDKQNGTRKSCCFSVRCCRRICSVTDRNGDKSQFTTLRIFTKTLRSGNNTKVLLLSLSAVTSTQAPIPGLVGVEC